MKSNRKLTFKRKLVCVAVASCFAITPVYANPIGAQVISGQAGFDVQGNVLTITNTPNTILNWQQFSISPGEITRFMQQSSSSAVLNRVLGQDPSQILGSLLSNGRVFLVNPNGILFGQGAVIDVAGLVASTLRLSDGDFLAGKLNFTNGVGAGGIDNQGSITAPNGGNIYLIAPDIRNSGLITSPQGEILLAAGHSVNLMDTANPNVQVTLNAPDTQAVNIGTLMAQSGKIGIYGALIDQQGTVDANTAVLGANGQIMLRASKDITLEPGSLTTASGMAGGVRDGGEIRIVADGTLNMRQDSQVHVDGGVNGGNGGFLELSGMTAMALKGSYTGRAQKAGYHNGSLLLDPLNINIVSGGSDLTVNGNIAASSGSASASFNVDPTALNGWLDVSLAAANDINVNSAISNADVNNGAAGGSLTLAAGNDINIAANIGTSGTRFNHDFTLTADNNINISNSIYQGNNTLTLTANADGIGSGDVNVSPGSYNPVIVNTLGNIYVDAASLIVQGGLANASPDSPPRHADAKLQAGGLIDITVTNGVTVQGGSANASASWGSSGSVQASADAEISATGALIIRNGGLTVQGGSAYAYGGASSTAVATANAKVSGSSVDIINGGSVNIFGGGATTIGSSSSSDGSYWYGMGPARGVATANADATLTTTGLLTVEATDLYIRGGSNNIQASASGSGIATATANALMHGNTINITTNSGVEVRGGDLCGDCGSSARAYGSGKASIAVNGELSATNSLTIHAGSNVIVAGGSGSSTQAYANGSGSATAQMNALMTAATIDITTTGGGSVQVSGGNGRWGQTRAYGSGVAKLEAKAELSATSGLTITSSGDVTVAGGSNSGYYSNDRAVAYWGGSAAANANALLHGGTVNISGGSVQVLGGDATGAFVGGSGVAATNANAELSAAGGLTITTTGGLTVAGGRDARASVSSGDSAVATANANATLSAGGNMTLNISSDVWVAGGSSAYTRAAGYGGGNNTAIAHASGGIFATGLLTIKDAANLTMDGGEGWAHARNNGTNIATTTANATMQAGTLDITLAGSLTMAGAGSYYMGAHASADSSGVNTATAQGNALISVTGAQTLNIAGDLNLDGGNASVFGSGTATAQAIALLDPGVMTAIIGGNVNITGGLGANDYGPGALAFAGIVNTGPINMTISGATGLTFTGGAGGASYSGWTVPGTGVFAALSSPINIIYTGGGVMTIIPAAYLDSAFIMSQASASPTGLLDFTVGETNDAATPSGLIETISLGNQEEDEDNDKPVCN